ncbi:MAG: NfeD family protein [Kiritimatiellia bacterium]
MKSWILSTLFSAAALAACAQGSSPAPAPPSPAGAEASGANGPLYVIPVHGVVDRGMLWSGAACGGGRLNASGIILRMDTPGGRVDIMEEIIQRLLRARVRTYTFVEKDAMSAGAIIALGTDEIYMAPGSRIGAATPILMSPEGGLQNIGAAEREKMNSAMDAVVRSIAQQKGRDAKLATAMVRAESGYLFHGEVICATNRILTLTNQEAEMRYGPAKEPVLSLGTVADIPALARKIGRAEARVVEQELSGLEDFARWLSVLGPILLMLASILLYVEMNTPGFGWPGGLSILFFVLFFFGQNIAGLSGYEEVLVFAAGLVLLGIEILVIPGFGIAGITGIALVFGAVFMAMIERLPRAPGDDWIPAAADIPGLGGALLRMLLVLAGSTAGMMFLATWLPRSSLVNSRLVLGQSLPRGNSLPAGSAGLAAGETALASTDLRPAGKVEKDGNLFDVVSSGDFIPRGTKVRVMHIEGARIVVEPLT